MSWHLLLIMFGVQLTHPRASGQPVETIALEDMENPCIQDFDAVIARQIPDDPDGPEVILAA